jgi:hypothetical protein
MYYFCSFHVLRESSTELNKRAQENSCFLFNNSLASGKWVAEQHQLNTASPARELYED